MPRLLISSSFVVLASPWNAFAFHPAACTTRLSLPNKCRNAKRFGHHYHLLLTLARTKPSDDVDDDDVDNLFFDDFGGDCIGSDGPASSSSSFSSSLSERIQEQRQGEERTAAKLAKNWKTGNWGVRGFILDSSDPIRESMADATASAENVGGGSSPRLGRGGDMSSNADAMEIPPIHVSTIVVDQSHMYDEGYESEKIDKIVVGRTDGSVLIVKMGTAYMTQFTAVPKLRVDDSSSDASPTSADQDTASSNGPSARVETELMNSEDVQKSLGDVVGAIGDGDEVNDMQYPMEDPFDELYGAGGNADVGQEPMQSQAMEGTPFEILHQFSAHENESITALLFINDIVFSAAGRSGEIRTWSMPEEDGNNSEAKMIPGKALSDAHSDEIVALKVLSSSPDSVEPDLLLSASRDGFALWDLNSGDLVTRCQMLTEASEPESIICADIDTSSVDGDVIYFGLSSGYVNCYFVNDVIMGASAGGVCPIPSSRFQAHDGVGGVTAVLAAGQGTSMSSNLQQQARSTSILLTGGADGLVKQW